MGNDTEPAIPIHSTKPIFHLELRTLYFSYSSGVQARCYRVNRVRCFHIIYWQNVTTYKMFHSLSHYRSHTIISRTFHVCVMCTLCSLQNILFSRMSLGISSIIFSLCHNTIQSYIHKAAKKFKRKYEKKSM